MPLGAQIVFRLPQDFDAAVRAIAGLTGRSLASELRQAVDAHVQAEARRQQVERWTDEEVDGFLADGIAPQNDRQEPDRLLSGTPRRPRPRGAREAVTRTGDRLADLDRLTHDAARLSAAFHGLQPESPERVRSAA